MNRLHKIFRRSARRSSAVRSRRPLFVENLETRQLLTGGPLTLTITELGTFPLQQVVITDNGPGDTSPAVGQIGYSTSSSPVSPFSDFTINNFSVYSNRTSATTMALLSTNGKITRSTSTGGAKTLQIEIIDAGFTSPTNPSTLTSQASATFTNPTSSDQAVYRSFANGTAAPVITLAPIKGTNPDSENQTAANTLFGDFAPFSLSDVYQFTLGASNSASVVFQNTGISTVVGTNPPVTIGNYVWNDANANGIQDAGESGIPNVTLTLTGTKLNGTSVTDTATTDANGHYLFSEPAGTYTVTVDASNSAGALAGFVASPTMQGSDRDKDSNPNPSGTTPVTLPGGSSDLTIDFGYHMPLLGQISGTKYLDVTGDGFSADDTALGGVTITLTDSSGHSITTQTANDGSYSFTDLAAGTYNVSEVVPSGYIQTGPTSFDPDVTVVNGTATYTVVVGAGQSVSGKDFDNAEKSPLTSGDTATIGFWQNKNGQALIRKMNGSAGATSLGNWLASSFPNLYGAAAGSANNLAGKTNAQVADYYVTLFKVKGTKTYAQVMANALAIYATNSTLAGGNYAASYGFNVSTQGTGAVTYNVGSNYAAFGVAKDTTLTIFQILQAINAGAVGGVIANGDSTLQNAVNSVASDINETGDI